MERRDREQRAERASRIEGLMGNMIEAGERAAIECLDCEIGEPHVCQRAWWEQRYRHLRGLECADPDCLCHPVLCECCGQPAVVR
ncbi:MAG: hypothetical protein JWO15_3892 [Sphingomonadales bacterium]|nr:hypothetical protein [Sphingomonadales bacterium]